MLPLMHKLWPVLVNRLRDLAKVLLVTYAQRANSPNSSCRLRIDEVGQLAVPATDTVKYVRLADSSAEQIKGFQCLTLDRTGHKISDNSLNHNLNISRSSLHNLPALLVRVICFAVS